MATGLVQRELAGGAGNMAAVIDFLLNKDGDEASTDTVTSPAFSTTKVLTAASVIVAPLATFLAKVIEGESFNLAPVHVVATILGLLAFVAILGAADVLARSYASAAQHEADAAVTRRDSDQLITFAKPLRATVNAPNSDPEVDVLAIAGGATLHYLVKQEDGTIAWTLGEKVRLLGAS